jgi:putative FmdB family regulatory protein
VPIYEYECTKCGHRFEVVQKVSDPPVGKCEKCKGKVERLVSSPAIQFKGSGWYVTDYARKGASSESSKSSKSEASSTSDKAEKTDKKSKGKEASDSKK